MLLTTAAKDHLPDSRSSPNQPPASTPAGAAEGYGFYAACSACKDRTFNRGSAGGVCGVESRPFHFPEIGQSSRILPLRRVVLAPPLTSGSDESQAKDKGQNAGPGWTPDARMISRPLSRQGTEPARKFNAPGFSAASAGAASAICLPRAATLGLFPAPVAERAAAVVTLLLPVSAEPSSGWLSPCPSPWCPRGSGIGAA